MSSHPDADLHPVATGPAKSIVDAHQKEEPLKLYSGWFCPFVQRAWSVLEEKKIPYQYIEVNPYNKPQSLLSLNPRGLVPTLQYDSKPLFESNVICEFLEEAYPDHKPSLLPEDVYLRAKTRIWIDFITSRLIPAFHRFLQAQGEEAIGKGREEFLGKLKELVKEGDRDGTWFWKGDEPTLIDFVVAPWIVRLWIFDHFEEGLGIPEKGKGGKDEAVWERLRRWRTALENRPSIRDTTSEREHYLPIYQRYAEDRAQSELAKSIRKGQGVV
ncbi:Glutathione S-transferase omega-1 [Pseudocercospora fuligena]|uniref:Glutathione S-transferase omega-1 n=1 Tax=Pseudocercospora fuligena TaxID=685502 RepID=A0A8H6VPX5_9PEZI|nr:Glutathione S-transferase omega-1 [Pseudocercospora fuligena]